MEDEARDRTRRRIAAAGSRVFGESPIEGLPPSPTSTKVIPLRGPVQVVLEVVFEAMERRGLYWCWGCEDWVETYSAEIGDSYEWGTYCKVCRESVEEQLTERDAEALWSAIPILRDREPDPVRIARQSAERWEAHYKAQVKRLVEAGYDVPHPSAPPIMTAEHSAGIDFGKPVVHPATVTTAVDANGAVDVVVTGMDLGRVPDKTIIAVHRDGKVVGVCECEVDDHMHGHESCCQLSSRYQPPV